MSLLPVDQLLAPLDELAPCGEDLEYDPAFLALEEAARGKPEQQFGDTVIPAQAPDWRQVHEDALALAERTRDLRLAVLLARAGAHLHGIRGYADGLALVAGLVEQHWDHVYPLLDADDANDPTMRLNALAPLVDAATGLADLRQATVGSGRIPLTVRQIELSAGKAEPHDDESVPTTAGIAQALQAIESQSEGVLEALQSPYLQLLRIESVLMDQVGSRGPDLKPLQTIARWLDGAAASARTDGAGDGATEAADVDFDSPSAGGAMASAPGALRHRDDVVRTLDQVCDWIQRNEPTNPAPLLIRRAQRLMTMDFMDIIRDLAPEGLSQIENIAGTRGD
ncbi:type VI secretion system protein TssA [Rhizobacter sp. LjRoot28]|uniref:type VI secretion system protein TssA n=1 Tax=Rhizobacter sp. LjRoot28 TaxID=3342309 RepID=UPI003ECDCB5D